MKESVCEGCPLRCDVSDLIRTRTMPPCAGGSADDELMFLLEERRSGSDVGEWIHEFVAVHFRDMQMPAVMANLERLDRAQSQEVGADARQLTTFTFSHRELNDYLAHRCEGIAHKSAIWLEKAAEVLWEQTSGNISRESCGKLRTYTLQKYTDADAKRKVLNFAKAFLKYLGKVRFDSRYEMFTMYLEMPKAVKVKKHVTERIVTVQDVKNVLSKADDPSMRALVLFGAYTGQRPYSTVKAVTVGQLREALRNPEKPVLRVLPEQDKVRMEHYVPLHPAVVKAIVPLLEHKDDDRRAFPLERFRQWTQEQKVLLSRCNKTFQPSDLRKFAEQHGDIIGWDYSNRAYVLTHGVSGVDWTHYKNPQPDSVYDSYMEVWGSVALD